MIQIRISDPRSLRSWFIKGAGESVMRLDSSAPLVHPDRCCLGSWILIWIMPKKLIHCEHFKTVHFFVFLQGFTSQSNMKRMISWLMVQDTNLITGDKIQTAFSCVLSWAVDLGFIPVMRQNLRMDAKCNTNTRELVHFVTKCNNSSMHDMQSWTANVTTSIKQMATE